VTPGGRRVRFVGVPFVGGGVGIGRGGTRRSGIGLLGVMPDHRVGLFRARPEEQLAEPADRGALVVHQLGQVGVQLEDRADQLGVLLVERSLSAAEDLLQSVTVHVDELQRPLHPAATG
jgi:hypothetical protein